MHVYREFHFLITGSSPFVAKFTSTTWKIHLLLCWEVHFIREVHFDREGNSLFVVKFTFLLWRLLSWWVNCAKSSLCKGEGVWRRESNVFCWKPPHRKTSSCKPFQSLKVYQLHMHFSSSLTKLSPPILWENGQKFNSVPELIYTWWTVKLKKAKKF